MTAYDWFDLALWGVIALCAIQFVGACMEIWWILQDLRGRKRR